MSAQNWLKWKLQFYTQRQKLSLNMEFLVTLPLHFWVAELMKSCLALKVAIFSYFVTYISKM